MASSGLVLGRRPLGAVLHSSNELGELSQWLCHDDSTINIASDIIISSSSIIPPRTVRVRQLSLLFAWCRTFPHSSTSIRRSIHIIKNLSTINVYQTDRGRLQSESANIQQGQNLTGIVYHGRNISAVLVSVI